uniref:(northern house mosquito) hypothetical protein n=1 Tax=Culex pipiens TaxID=7175 RepID=A0A8D8F754_CULPI
MTSRDVYKHVKSQNIIFKNNQIIPLIEIFQDGMIHVQILQRIGTETIIIYQIIEIIKDQLTKQTQTNILDRISTRKTIIETLIIINKNQKQTSNYYLTTIQEITQKE